MEPGFGREFVKNLGWMTLILIGMFSVYGAFGLLLYLASEEAGIAGIVAVTVIFIVVVVFAMTVARRIARRRIRARYARDLAVIEKSHGKIH